MQGERLRMPGIAQGRGFGLVDYVLNAEPAVQAPAAAMNAG
jgi:hypothetical protein